MVSASHCFCHFVTTSFVPHAIYKGSKHLVKFINVLPVSHCVSFAARSPLYSHISATIQGLLTIRVYKEETDFIKKLHFYLNEHSKSWHAKISTSRWFGLRLDMIGLLFVMAMLFISVPLADSKFR